EARVSRLVYLAHSAGADRREDFVRAQPCARCQSHAQSLYAKRSRGSVCRGTPFAPISVMRLHLNCVIGALLVVTFVTPAAAQRRSTARTPAADMWAVGGSIGPTTPADASLDSGVDLVGNAEYYVTPRVSVRGQLGGARWDVLNRGFNGRVNPFYVDGNV